MFDKELLAKIDALAEEIKDLRRDFIARNRHLHGHTSTVIRSERARIDTGTQRLLAEMYRQKAEDGIILPFREVEFSNYSQSADDGVLHYIYSLVGTQSKRALEICSGIGMECNAANLILHHGWAGLLIEGDENRHKQARSFFGRHFAPPHMPNLMNIWVDRETIGEIVSKVGYGGDIDLLSLDMDGVDYWILEALLKVTSPRVMILETQLAWGPEMARTVHYASDFQADRKQHQGDGSGFLYAGASVAAFQKLGRQHGYRLVGKVGVIGPNTIFLREDVGAEYFPEIDAASLYDDIPQGYMDHYAGYRQVGEDYDWVEL